MIKYDDSNVLYLENPTTIYTSEGLAAIWDIAIHRLQNGKIELILAEDSGKVVSLSEDTQFKPVLVYQFFNESALCLSMDRIK